MTLSSKLAVAALAVSLAMLAPPAQAFELDELALRTPIESSQGADKKNVGCVCSSDQAKQIPMGDKGGCKGKKEYLESERGGGHTNVVCREVKN